MDEPQGKPGANDAPQNPLISAVAKMDFPDGHGFGFSLLDEESKKPCFSMIFETEEDAAEGRSMMEELIDHALWFEVPSA